MINYEQYATLIARKTDAAQNLAAAGIAREQARVIIDRITHNLSAMPSEKAVLEPVLDIWRRVYAVHDGACSRLNAELERIEIELLKV